MFLEERVEQLENLSVDQGRQLESIANGLANLTVDVRAIREDQNKGFARIDEKFDKVYEELAVINARLDGHDKQFEELKTSLDEVQASLNEVKSTLQLVVKLLTER